MTVRPETATALRAGLVARPRLVERLDEGMTRELVLVCTPPGFGKTTLLADWVQATDTPTEPEQERHTMTSRQARWAPSPAPRVIPRRAWIRSRWPDWVGPAAAGWSLGYGLLGLHWTLVVAILLTSAGLRHWRAAILGHFPGGRPDPSGR